MDCHDLTIMDVVNREVSIMGAEPWLEPWLDNIARQFHKRQKMLQA